MSEEKLYRICLMTMLSSVILAILFSQIWTYAVLLAIPVFPTGIILIGLEIQRII